MFGHRVITFIILLLLLVIVSSECKNKKNKGNEIGRKTGNGKAEGKPDEERDKSDKDKSVTEASGYDKNEHDRKRRHDRWVRNRRKRQSRRRTRRRNRQTRATRRPTKTPSMETTTRPTNATTRTPTEKKEKTTRKLTKAPTSKPTRTRTRKQTDKSLKKLEKYENSIDVENKTQVYDVLSIFTDIISGDTTTEEDKDTIANKMKKDIMALRLMEKIGKRMTSQMKPTAEKPATVGAVVGDQVFGVAALNGSGLSGFSFPEQIKDLGNTPSLGARVDLPDSVLAASSTIIVNLVFMIYNPSSAMIARTGDQPEYVNIGGKVVMASIFPPSKIPLADPVVITIQNFKILSNVTVKPTCGFLIENSSSNDSERSGIWSTKGCELAFSNNTHSKCHCYHLTNFAILLKFSENKLSEEHELALNAITYVGLSLSIIGCFLTLVVHLLLP